MSSANLPAVVSPPPAAAPPLIRWISTSNPFYVISAGLFLVGLRLSFGTQTRDIDTWALMIGLAGYTLLLAAAALLLVRFAGVWNDVRTVLLLVVLMFLATSVTFDELLALDPHRGTLFNLAGLLFAVAVTEGLLRGIDLRLPAAFRVPYYLVLALFFLYPVALTPWLREPRGETLMWGLWGFAPLAGVLFLTLLPAVRLGPDYLRNNGSPWPWPYYPWSVFVFLAVAVVGRSVLLCWSLHLLDGGTQYLIFGPHFLVPFGLALAVLVLELGLVAGTRATQFVALAIPAGLVALAAVGHRDDPVYAEFLGHFAARLGGTPLFLALLAAGAFYAYAWLRRVPLALDGLSAAVAALAVVGPESLTFGELTMPSPIPLLAAAAVQAGLGLWRHGALRLVVAGLGLSAAGAAALPVGTDWPARAFVAFHLGVFALLAIGAAFDDETGRGFRLAGSGMVLFACVTVVFGQPVAPGGLPGWVVPVYPVGMAAVLAAYGLMLRYRPALAVAGAALASGLVMLTWRGYRELRQEVAGLDFLVLSLALLPVAVLISLGKAGVLGRWVERWRGRVTNPVD
jgi:hypothetical protein